MYMPKKHIEKLINKEVENILENLFDSESAELCVYDFDDTLIKSDSTINLVNVKTGERKELTSHEFHEYHLEPGEQFDLSAFAGLDKNTKKLPLFSKLQADYSRLGPSGVAILTARPAPEPVHQFLRKNGLSGIEVAAVGDLSPVGDVRDENASRKKSWLEKQIKRRNLKRLSFYDDNAANIGAARELEAEYPDVSFTIELIA
jgi:hypothetical protein